MDEGKCAREYFCLEKDFEGIRKDYELEKDRGGNIKNEENVHRMNTKRQR